MFEAFKSFVEKDKSEKTSRPAKAKKVYNNPYLDQIAFNPDCLVRHVNITVESAFPVPPRIYRSFSFIWSNYSRIAVFIQLVSRHQIVPVLNSLSNPV